VVLLAVRILKQMRNVFTDPDAAARSGHFFKALSGDDRSITWCARHGVSLEKTAGEGIGTAGGWLVPSDFDNAVVAVLDRAGAFRQGAEVRQTTSGNQIRPRRTTTGLTASFVAEGAQIPETQFALDAVETTAKKRAVLCRTSSELFDDSAVDVANLVAQIVGYSFAALEDDCGWNGDGTSTYGGVLGLSKALVGKKSAVAAASGHHTFASVDSSDLGNLVGAVIGSAVPNAAWYCSAQCYGQALCRLSVSTGGLAMLPNGQPSYLGFPVRVSSKLPNGSVSDYSGLPMLYFGDLSMSSLIVERRQTVVAVSRQRLLETDQFLIRATQRIDIVNHDVGSATAPGPVSMLVGSA
jgi:HK97 family phage major capsid protein